MIARLEGTLAEKRPEAVVVDVAGVGYELRVPLSTYLELPDEGKTIRLRVHTHVREDTLQLYGFRTEQERIAFGLLLGVSKVGPRMAIAILSGLSPALLARAVEAGNLSQLRGIPGVGAKTAERILIELRDRIGVLESLPAGKATSGPEPEALSALVNLGYSRTQAEQAIKGALRGLSGEPSLEALIREALRVAAR